VKHVETTEAKMIERRHLLRMLPVALLAPALSGCLRPLYGSAAHGGLSASQALSGVSIEIAGDRLAHYLRNELEFNLRGDGNVNAPKTHRLRVLVTQNTLASSIDRLSGAADSVNMVLNARYQLFKGSDATPMNEGTAAAAVSYDRDIQRFASTRAARDAEIRGARQLAEEIRTRVALHLSAGR
jgi:LPS-assembly lipoprotein